MPLATISSEDGSKLRQLVPGFRRKFFIKSFKKPPSAAPQAAPALDCCQFAITTASCSFRSNTSFSFVSLKMFYSASAVAIPESHITAAAVAFVVAAAAVATSVADH